VFRLGLRNVRAHRTRFVLCLVAVVLGVSFVSASMVFTDTLAAGLRSTIASTTADLTVTAESAVDSTGEGLGGTNAKPVLLGADVVQAVSAVDGVAVADAQLAVTGVHLLGKDGTTFDTGRPMFGASWPHDQQTATFGLTEGKAPWGRGELTLDRGTAKRAGYQRGDLVRVVTASGTVEARLIGITTAATTGPAAESPLVALDPATAQLVLLGEPGWTSVAIHARPGVDPATLRTRVQAAAGAGMVVRTAPEVIQQAQDAVNTVFGNAGSVLMLFAGLALFVGSFLIFNTFAVLVAQRVRELGLLRAVGASRAQVTRSVLAEAVAVGAIGSTIGLLIGVLVALGLRAALGTVGVDLPGAPVKVQVSTLIWSYLVGVGVTVVSAYLPARRASRLQPVEALRDDVAPADRSMRNRLAVGGVLLIAAAGGYVTATGSPGYPGAIVLGLCAAMALVGAMLVSPALATYLSIALSRPARGHATTLLGVTNAQRNPRRTSATASALMIALAVIGLLGVIASSAKASIDKTVLDTFGTADFVVIGNNGEPLPGSVAGQVAKVDGVGAAGRLRTMAAEVAGHRLRVTGVGPAVLRGPIVVKVEDGSLDRLDAGAAVLPGNIARTLGATVGDTIDVRTRAGTHKLTVGAVLASNRQLDAIVTSIDTFTTLGGGNTDTAVYVDVRDGADPGATGQRIAAALASNPLVGVRDQAGYAKAQRGPVDSLAGAVYALLALAVVIAILGIVNTLLLSVLERTREIGLLRAIGMERRQVREMVRVESVLIALLGAALGLLIGVSSGAAIQSVMRDDGLPVLDIPVLQLFVIALAAALTGVLAALWPARHAARLDVLAAIGTE
jgi:putative ABC transport system permease protein